MPAKSKAQQRYFGMMEAGKIPAKGVSPKVMDEFAKTKTTGLPNKVKIKK